LELEPVLTATRWNILKILADKPASPLQISKELKTTIANVSQQLRLLDAYGLVKKERVQGSDKRKPRKLYSIAQDSAYYVTIAEKFAEKHRIKLSKHKNTILKIWSTEKEDWHYYLEKFYWKIESRLNKIRKIGVDVSQPNMTVFIEANDGKEFESIGKSLDIRVHTVKEIKQKEVKIIFENE
jgi:predicted transcriptional regulator